MNATDFFRATRLPNSFSGQAVLLFSSCNKHSCRRCARATVSRTAVRDIKICESDKQYGLQFCEQDECLFTLYEVQVVGCVSSVSQGKRYTTSFAHSIILSVQAFVWEGTIALSTGFECIFMRRNNGIIDLYVLCITGMTMTCKCLHPMWALSFSAAADHRFHLHGDTTAPLTLCALHSWLGANLSSAEGACQHPLLCLLSALYHRLGWRLCFIHYGRSMDWQRSLPTCLSLGFSVSMALCFFTPWNKQ